MPLESSHEYLGFEDLPIERYISPEYARLKAERLWSKLWQIARRESDRARPTAPILSSITGRTAR